jgi:uncharacterized cupin superfamily protein
MRLPTIATCRLQKFAQATGPESMHVVTHCEAPMYQASGHTLTLMRRLQGMEAGPSDTLWVGLSEIDPGGGVASWASDVEKFYVCLEGEIEIAATKGDTTIATVLRPLDSCRIEPHEARQLTNRSKKVARILLVTPRRS